MLCFLQVEAKIIICAWTRHCVVVYVCMYVCMYVCVYVCMKNVTGKSASQYAICKDSNGIFSANPNKVKKITTHTLHFKVLKHIRIRVILITSEYIYVHTHTHTHTQTHTHTHT